MAYIGQINIFSFDFAPPGWAPCDGQVLPIAQYTELFTLIGNKFGGDGENNFALPDYKGQAPSGSGYFISLLGEVNSAPQPS